MRLSRGIIGWTKCGMSGIVCVCNATLAHALLVSCAADKYAMPLALLIDRVVVGVCSIWRGKQDRLSPEAFLCRWMLIFRAAVRLFEINSAGRSFDYVQPAFF